MRGFVGTGATAIAAALTLVALAGIAAFAQDDATPSPSATPEPETTVAAVVDDGAPEDTNEYELDMQGTVTPVRSQIATTGDPGDASSYAIALLPYEGPELTAIECGDADGEAIEADIDLGERSIVFAPPSGAAVRCVFMLGERDGLVQDDGSDASSDPGPAAEMDEESPAVETAPGLAPRAGRWNIVNLPATITCDGADFDVPRTKDKGTVEVRRDGDRIITRGFSEGRGKTILDRSADDPSVYLGQMTVAGDGAESTLEVTMEVPKRTRITGNMSGEFMSDGIVCSMNRDFTARFAEK